MTRALLATVIFLSACSPSPIVIGCPPVREWTREQQKQMADELAALPPDSMLRAGYDDYGYMREKARACAGR